MTDQYEGHHLIADLVGGHRLDDVDHVETCLREAAAVAGATLLEVRLHAFGPGMGVTGVALLAESHISIHTWPEHGSACVDIFMCGRAHDLEAALGAIASGLNATVLQQTSLKRRFAGTA